MPKVSIIIPSYNCADYVRGAVDSALAQTFHDYEIIVVDDGSSDDTREVLEAYGRESRFRYVYQENRGLPGARNAGARASQADYLAFLDADDALAPEALEVMTAELERSGTSWCLIDILKVLGEKKEIRRTTVPAGDLFHEILRNDFIRRAMFFKRQDFFDVGMYDEAMRYREDWELNIRMFGKQKPFAYIGRPLYWYTWREGSITTGNRGKVLVYTEMVLRKHHKRLADAGDRTAAKLYAKNMWDLGRAYFSEQRNTKRAAACVRESLAYDFNARRLFHPVVYRLRRWGVRQDNTTP